MLEFEAAKNDGHEFTDGRKFDEVMWKIAKEPAWVMPQNSAIKPLNISIMPAGLEGLPLFASVIEKEVNGIGMGVLENGQQLKTLFIK